MVKTSKFIKIASEYYKNPHASTAHKLTKAPQKKRRKKQGTKWKDQHPKKTNEPPKRPTTRGTSSFQTPPLVRNI
jgi:hypothetical protein